ncbi:MAG TPA: glycosyltransferase family 2 protein [Pseudolabrys sp.]|jgi:poly-beta-1,6-N-acetyl-D-glucosamine synthase|nr:glycosyltransferase family 2 protein [Pseudolabrys sp.]
MDALSFLGSLDVMSLVYLFWYTALLEIPRYFIGALVVPLLVSGRDESVVDPDLSISIILVGHNEEKPLPACVHSLAEQTILSVCKDVQIIVVDDGSTDRMREVALRLQREGRVDNVLILEQRGGKSAGVNLALSVARGDIVVISDVDTTFDRDALAELTSCFSDPLVGAVSGNLGVRNASASVATRYQAIEYAVGISLGRCIADAFGTLSVISGAFGAFRRAALESVGRQDVEVGEDADLTMKLRSAGWRLRFARRANALTDVPETFSAFIAQRLRWDRGLITIWARKYRSAIDPRHSSFRISDAVSVADVIFFQVVLAVTFPVYLGWLFYYFGWFATTILAATIVGYAVLDLIVFLAAATVGIRIPLWLIAYLPLFTAVQITLARAVRLVAIAQELIFRTSYRDPYVPRGVMEQVEVV